ncbi:MAG: glycine zipper 2TM domain-containing protein [Burkholderiaceae bacterium]
MLRSLASVAGIVVLAGSLGACASPTRQQVGTGAGAVVGGVVGHEVFGGTLGTLGGAAVGGVVGNEVTKH